MISISAAVNTASNAAVYLPSKRRQHQPVGLLQPRAAHLPVQHRHLLPQYR
jgi:hypothetical protein